MSLLSQQDRKMVEEALEFYILSLKSYPNHDQDRLTQFCTLLNWIKLEHFKHED